MGNNHHKRPARKKPSSNNFVAAPAGMAYPGRPFRWTQLGHMRTLLKTLAVATGELEPGQIEAHDAMIDGLNGSQLREVLSSNGFTKVTRKELHVTRTNATISPSAGILPSKAPDEGGSPEHIYFTELAGQRR